MTRPSPGADEPGTQQLAADPPTAGLLVVDDRDPPARTGAPAAAGLPGSAADAALAGVLRGGRPCRSGPATRPVHAPVGPPWRDLTVARVAYEWAEREQTGHRVELPGRAEVTPVATRS
ncbi:hypothetical protein I3F60_13355 [Streptomyces sp. MUM 136J]|uniref:hypothetical protein n=1 Tax=Streptomyces sp. MUM 136J TaxID=2791992 RepID=UPI001F0428BF|nr:hypothetical protein [Streptomyces sp. MUM 136J]MCH0570223.1 hypothetical protein [Streptomyces sp. MUM 136J]